MLDVETLTRSTKIQKLQLRRIFRQMGFDGLPDGPTLVSDEQCLLFWVHLLVDRLKFLEVAQRELLCEELSSGVVDLTTQIRKELSPMLVIADGQYATWTGKTGWLDLGTGNDVPRPLSPPLETVGYNLTTLFRRNQEICQRLKAQLSPS